MSMVLLKEDAPFSIDELQRDLIAKWPDLPAPADASEDDGTAAGFTSGLTALGHMEWEALDVPEKPGELHERFMELSNYVLANAAVIKDGDTVGRNAKEKIRVVFSPSTFGRDGLVMRLVYENAPRPWWKFW